MTQQRSTVSEVFECLHCGATSPVARRPLKCGYCGHGAGVVISRPPAPSAFSEPGKSRGGALAHQEPATILLSK